MKTLQKTSSFCESAVGLWYNNNVGGVEIARHQGERMYWIICVIAIFAIIARAVAESAGVYVDS